jgi:hypothetical protein
MGHLNIVHCFINELGADVGLTAHDGSTPLMTAACNKQHEVVRLLLKLGADPQALQDKFGTAADIVKIGRAPNEHTAYLEARTHCANPCCTNAGLKKCERCLQAYFCGSACIRAHWPAHKAECTAAAAKVKAAGGKPS